MGLLANRGVESERIVAFLIPFLYDPVESTRVWAVEGIAFSGSVEQIPLLLDIFGSDESEIVRQRAACSLAQSGMLTWHDRWQVVPRPLAMVESERLPKRNRGWAFQALRDTAGERLPAVVTAWREWWEGGGRDQTPERPAA